MSCMHQSDDTLVQKSQITGDVLVVNQCGHNGLHEYDTPQGRAKMIFTTDRGLTKSRNMAIANSQADICLLCDDDEVFVPDYENMILSAYEELPQADVIIFKMVNYPAAFEDKIMELKFPQTMKVCSWQISFRRQRLLEKNVRFDELLGAGSGNGAEEELKFLLDCQRARLKIWYVPKAIASVAQAQSTWFEGFTEKFFEDRGATTRYILGAGVASVYAVYYAVKKKKQLNYSLPVSKALAATFRGIREDRITKQLREKKQREKLGV